MTICFGENLRKLRNERKLTQSQLAAYLGVSYQAISKWEKSETYPDIASLPAIASFFAVTTDYLLGVNEQIKEAEIQAAVDSYYENWQLGKYDVICRDLLEIMHKHPGDYRLTVRYLNSITAESKKSGVNPVKRRNEADSIYADILVHCTTDSIRAWAHRIMCNYYKGLAETEGSGIGIADCERILENMPLMQNARDYYATYLYEPGEKRAAACRDAINELVYLSDNVIINICRNECAVINKINAVEVILGFINSVYTDGDYGKQYLNVINNYAWLGRWYAELGDTDNAVNNLKKCAETAARFDLIPDDAEVCHTSELVKGKIFQKNKLPMYRRKSERGEIRKFIDSIPDIGSVIGTAEYSAITDILNTETV